MTMVMMIRARRQRLFVLVVLVLIIALICSSFLKVVAGNEIETTREEILESRKRRSKQLEAMLVDAKQRLADHTAGIRLLEENEKADLAKKADIYQRKLDTMKETLTEREVELILQREKIREERRREREARNEL